MPKKIPKWKLGEEIKYKNAYDKYLEAKKKEWEEGQEMVGNQNTIYIIDETVYSRHKSYGCRLEPIKEPVFKL